MIPGRGEGVCACSEFQGRPNCSLESILIGLDSRLVYHDFCNRFLKIDYQKSNFKNRLLKINYQKSNFNNRLSKIEFQKSIIKNRISKIDYQIDCQRSFTCKSKINCKKSIIKNRSSKIDFILDAHAYQILPEFCRKRRSISFLLVLSSVNFA